MPIKEVHFSQSTVMWWHSLFSHCITSQKVMGSITDRVIGIFY